MSENFQYLITINQKELKKICPNITYELASVLGYIINICTDDNEKIEMERIDGYTWINYKALIGNMPLIKGKTEKTVGDKIKKLEQLGLITSINSYKNGKPRKNVKLTRNCIPLVSEPIDKSLYKELVGIKMSKFHAKILTSDKDFLTTEGKHIWEIVRDPCRYDDKEGFIWKKYKAWLKNQHEPITVA